MPKLTQEQVNRLVNELLLEQAKRPTFLNLNYGIENDLSNLDLEASDDRGNVEGVGATERHGRG